MPSKKQVVTAKKLSVLDVILNERETLFAPISPVITQEAKVHAWTRVLHHARKVGLASDHRDWTFMRDKLYSVWKSRTMKRWEDSLAGTNKGKTLNEIDLKILEIIGEKPPPASGTSSKISKVSCGGGSVGPLPPTPPETHQPESVYLESGEDSNQSSSRASETREPRRKYPSRAKKPRHIDVADSDTENVQDLTLELLKTEIYLRKLQARKLEIELGLPCSSVTKNFEVKKDRRCRKNNGYDDDSDDDDDIHKHKQDSHHHKKNNTDDTIIKFEK